MVSKISILIEKNNEYISCKKRIFMDYDQLELIINDPAAKNYSIKFSLISRVFPLNEKLTTDIAENLKFNEKLNWMVIFFLI